MNLTKREFMQVLGAGTMAGMGLGTYAEADAATAATLACPTLLLESSARPAVEAAMAMSS